MDGSLFKWIAVGVLAFPGLVWIDHLALTPVQIVGLAAAMWLMFSRRPAWSGIFIMLAAFWNCPMSTDTRLLFQSAGSLQHFTWRQFLGEFAIRDYVRLQPPFYSFYISRLPVLWVHQLMFAAWWGLCCALIRVLYGDRARFLCSTPIFLLMGTQPGNDGVLFGLVLMTLRLKQLGYTRLAAVVFGLAYPVKPLALLVLPAMALRLRLSLLGSLAMWGLYIRWSLQYYFGVQQWHFLLSQLCLL